MATEGELRIAVAGVGGAGCNTINRLARFGIKDTKLIAFNTDKKHLGIVHESAEKFLLGASVTKGLGAGGFPEVAEKAANVSRDKIAELLEGTDLLFLTAGMGGGTGTGASPVIAEIAKEQGAIVFGFVTYPFLIEKARLKKAEDGIDKLLDCVDTLVIIDNNRLVDYAKNLQIEKAFELADLNREEEVARVQKLQNLFIDELARKVPRAEINGSLDNRIVNNINISLPGMNSENVVIRLDAKGIACGTRSACIRGVGNGSYVVRAIGKSEET